jgi:DNA-binding MarR family transcriptional regulator
VPPLPEPDAPAILTAADTLSDGSAGEAVGQSGTEMAARESGTFEPKIGHLPWEIKRAEREAARTIDNLLRSTGLTKSQFGVMQALSRMKKASSADLARSFFVSPQAMVGLIAALEEKGYIERNPAAARVIEATITPSGRAAFKRAREALNRMDDRLAAGFTPAEADQLSALLTRFIDVLHHIDDPGWQADAATGAKSTRRRRSR